MPSPSGSTALESLFDAASISFPPAERFAIAAVAAYRDRLSDPALRQQVLGFLQQEALHAHLHTALNAALAASNPSCRRAEKIVDGMFKMLSRMPKALRLSVSAGMEHIAALLADVVLRHAEDIRTIFSPPVADMWVFHAVEETEHKSVCFDVYRAGVGTGCFAYLNRVAGMLIAAPVFLVVMLGICAAVLRSNRSSAPPTVGGNVGSSSLGIIWSFVPWGRYFSYFKPSFHPWSHDNSALVRDWMRLNPDFAVLAARPA